MSNTLSASEKPLQKIFCNDYTFEIPEYQRPYSWTVQQASELLSDIWTASNEGIGKVSDLNPYFLGNIVLTKGDDALSKVIDGQQRLTTLTILLSVLREHIKSGLTEFIYEEGNELTGAQTHFRLKLRVKDKTFFRDNVQEKNGLVKLLAYNPKSLRDSQLRIFENAKYFFDTLEKWPSDHIKHLASFLLQKCFLVVVATKDEDSAYRIFSVLNSRGLDLTLSDILKARIIGKLDVSERESCTTDWENREADLGRENFDELFNHIRMIRMKTKLKKTALKEYEEDILPKETPHDFLKSFAPFSEAFAKIRKADFRDGTDAENERINNWLKWLKQIDNTDWIPPAIARLSDSTQTPAQLLSFLRDMERLAAYLFVCRANVNVRLERYGKLLRAIEDKKDLSQASSLQLSSDEKREFIEFLQGPIYETSRTRAYIMLRLDSVQSKGALHFYPTISIEHVLPQNPAKGSQWLTWWPNDNEREEWVHRLGNLLLLSRMKNSQASNKNYIDKVNTYFLSSTTGVSAFPLTTQAIAHATWTPAVVKQRQNDLLDALKTEWRLN